MELLVFADLHSMNNIEWQVTYGAIAYKPDIILLLGDIPAKTARRIKKMSGGIPTVYVLGNHDSVNEYAGIKDLISVDEWASRVCGMIIAGISGGPRYKPDRSLCLRTQEEVSKIASDMPKADILITHESPWNLLGTSEAKCGFKGISEYIVRCSPRLHIFGHHHTNMETMIEKTKEICVYRCAQINWETLKTTVLF